MDLRANTAVDVLIGPFVDSTDGNTTEDGLTISQADVKLSKNGQALAQKNDATQCAFDDDGYYNCELDATDTNTEGNLVLIVHESGALPVRHEYNVLAEAAWDSLYVAKDDGFMDVNIKTIGRSDTQETEASNLESACSNYSVTRGLTGTAVPAAAADGAGGIPISDAGGLDLDTQLANTHEVTAARMGALTDWIDGERLDLLLDTLLTRLSAVRAGYLDNLNGHTPQSGDSYARIGANGVGLSAVPWNANWDAEVQSECADALVAFFTSAAQLVDDIWDELLTGATHNIATSAGRRLRGIQEFQGYEGGAIWIDTVNGVAGTVDYENGTVENPVDSIADANTLAASLGISKFYVKSGSTITFVGAQENQQFEGCNWTLALGGQSISGTTINCADVTGIATGAIPPSFKDCHFGDVTIPPSHLSYCGLEGYVTMGSAGDFFFDDCHSGVAGTDTPSLDFGAGLDASDVNFRRYSGGIEIENMGAGAGSYKMSLEGFGQLIINANCSADSEIAIRGHFTITDNAGGAITLSDDARYDAAQIENEVQDALEVNNLDHLLKTPVANNADMTAEVADGTVMSNMLSKTSDTSSYTVSSDSLEGISDTGGGDATEAKQNTMITHLTEIKGAGFVEANHSNKAIIDTGNVAWITGGGVGGASTVTITVVDGDGAAIQDCSVQIWNTALDSLVSYGTTNANGQKQLSADDGSYKVKLKKGGFSFTDPEDLTVSGTTTQTYTGTSTIPSAPASAQSCRVYDYLFMPDGSTPFSNAEVNAKAKIVSLPENSNDILHGGIEIDGIYNESTGLIYWDVVKGSEVEFIIIDFGIRTIKTIPTTDTARLIDIT